MINSQFAAACLVIGFLLFIAGTSLEYMPVWLIGGAAFVFGLYGVLST
jgi:hypothetical protein